MKKHLNYILYGIALLIILIPIAMTEVVKSPMSQPQQTIVLSVGLLVLILGKLFSIKKKRSETGESIVLDALILVCLVAMIVWMFLKIV